MQFTCDTDHCNTWDAFQKCHVEALRPKLAKLRKDEAVAEKEAGRNGGKEGTKAVSLGTLLLSTILII